MSAGVERRCLSAIQYFALFALLGIAGCSEGPGGGGIGGTGKAIAPDSLVVGVVDGFGSIVLNNQRYETDSATVFVDGNAAHLADLSVGMAVTARALSGTGEIVQLRYQPDVAGVVSAVNNDQNRFDVLGQAVYLTAETLLDEIDRSAIRTGVVLEVSGNRGADNSIVATYVRLAENLQRTYIVGRVQEPPGGDGAMIGNAVIDASMLAEEMEISVKEYETTYLELGALVRVEAVTGGSLQNDQLTSEAAPAGNGEIVLQATGVTTVTRPPYNAGDSVQVLGVVGASVGQSSYMVADVVVTLDADSVSVSSFGLPMEFPAAPENRPVLVDGVALSANGAVQINRIQFLDEN